MLKKILGSLLVLVFLVFAVSAGYAVIKGFEGSTQSLVKVGESVTVPEGAEVRAVVAVGGSVTIYGHVVEDVVSVGGSVFLKDTAVVGGDVVSVGGKVIKEPGAVTKGEVVEVSVAGIAPTVSFFTKGGLLKGLLVFRLLTFIGFVVLAIILVALFTPHLGKISVSLERSLWKNFLSGLLIAIIFAPVIFILAISIVGIVLIPVWAIVIAAAGIFGYVAAGHLLGKKVLRAFKISGKSMITETLTGIVLLGLVGLVPLIGFIVKSIACACGLGGV